MIASPSSGANARLGHGTPGAISAWSVASDAGYTFLALPLSPRLGLRAGIISGDEDPADPDLQTFNPLFPKGKYFDEIGLLGPYNLIDVHPILTFTISGVARMASTIMAAG